MIFRFQKLLLSKRNIKAFKMVKLGFPHHCFISLKITVFLLFAAMSRYNGVEAKTPKFKVSSEILI